MNSVIKQMGFPETPEAAEHLLAYYKRTERNLRRCHPRDLLLQVRNFCIYKCIPQELTPQSLDFAVDNYFAVM